MGFDLGTAVGYLDLDTSGFKRGFHSAAQDLKTFQTTAKGAESKITSLSSAYTAVGKSMTAGITIPLVGIGTTAMAVGNKFEAQMSRVKAISGATEDEFKALSDQALDLGAKTSFSASEAAAGMENLASAGFNTNEIMSAMPGLLDLAASSGASVATSSEIAASAIRGFGLEASSAGHVADVFAEAAARTNAQTEDMGMAMKYIAPVAHAMGLSIEETAAAIGIMSDAGIKGSQAGTSLRGALTRLTKPTKQMKETMEDLSLSFYDTKGNMLPLEGIISQLESSMSGLSQEQRNQALVTLFGQESLSGMLALMSRGSGELSELTESFKQVDGAASDMSDTMLDNTSGSIEEMMGSLETLAIKLQQIMAPAVTSVTKWITRVINKFSSLDEGTQKTIVKLLAVAAAIGPVSLLLGKLFAGVSKTISVFHKFKSILIASKATLTAFSAPILAVIASVVALKLAWDSNFGGIRDATAEVGESLKGIFDSICTLLQSFVQFFTDLWNSNWLGCKEIFTDLWGSIEESFSYILDAIVAAFQVFEAIFSGDWEAAWEGIKGIFSGVCKAVVTLLAGLFKAMIQGLVNICEDLKNASRKAFEKIHEGFKEIWKDIKEWFAKVIEDPIGTLTQLGEDMYNKGKEVLTSLWDGFKSVWGDITGWVSEGVKWIKDKFSFSIKVPEIDTGSVEGSYASGLSYVPKDMVVKVHEGESIHTKQQTKRDPRNSQGGDTYNFFSPEPIDEVRAARLFEQTKRDLAEGF